MLSPLFLDLWPTPTLGKKNTHIGTLGTDGLPTSSARGLGLSGVNGPTILDSRVVVYRVGVLDHFSMATPSPPYRAPSRLWFCNFSLSLSLSL